MSWQRAALVTVSGRTLHCSILAECRTVTLCCLWTLQHHSAVWLYSSHIHGEQRSQLSTLLDETRMSAHWKAVEQKAWDKDQKAFRMLLDHGYLVLKLQHLECYNIAVRWTVILPNYPTWVTSLWLVMLSVCVLKGTCCCNERPGPQSSREASAATWWVLLALAHLSHQSRCVDSAI